MSDQEIIKSQAEEIERLRAVLEKIRSPFNCMTRGETCELINAALATPSGHLVSQNPQNMNDNPGCALDLSDNSSGPRMVRREVLEELIKRLRARFNSNFPNTLDDIFQEAQAELDRTKEAK